MLLPLYLHCRPADQPFPSLKNIHLTLKKTPEKGQTDINKCIRTPLNVQCRRCPNHKLFKVEQKQPRVVYLLCSVSMGMLLKTECIECITKKRQQFLVSVL